jgi:nicotinamidase-related amidase
MLIDHQKSSLFIVDMQERLLPAMAEAKAIEHQNATLLKAARQLDVPIAASEQYPKGLGPTVASLRTGIGNAPVFEKTSFSCWRDPKIKAHLIHSHEQGRPQAVIAGIESHVCVLQTAIDMAQAGFAVFVVADATGSRAPSSKVLALARLQQNDVQVVTTEMVLFEWLAKAETPAFKTISALIR